MFFFRNERRVTFKALDQAWKKRTYHVKDFDPQTSRYIIVSDMHKGDGRKSDDFRRNEYIYCHALQYYLDNDFGLVLAGDIEEGWENFSYKHINRMYKDTAFAIERRFVERGPDHYIRLFGNHDHDWKDQSKVKQYLWPMLGEIEVYESARLGDDIFIVHGHQGQPFDDPERFRFSYLPVRWIWAPIIQGLLGLGSPTSASKNTRIRKKRDDLLYRWAKKHRRLLIAGHTHQAMFLSSSEAGQMNEQLREIDRHDAEDDYEWLAVKRHLEDMIQASPDLLKADRRHDVPCYFNSGCGVYSNGLTGIEIDQGAIRLVKWEITDTYCDGETPDTIKRHPELGYFIARRIYQESNLAGVLDQIQRH